MTIGYFIITLCLFIILFYKKYIFVRVFWLFYWQQNVWILYLFFNEILKYFSCMYFLNILLYCLKHFIVFFKHFIVLFETFYCIVWNILLYCLKHFIVLFETFYCIVWNILLYCLKHFIVFFKHFIVWTVECGSSHHRKDAGAHYPSNPAVPGHLCPTFDDPH